MSATANQNSRDEFGGIIPEAVQDIIGSICIVGCAILLTLYESYGFFAQVYFAHINGTLVARFATAGWYDLAEGVCILFVSGLGLTISGAFIGVIVALIILHVSKAGIQLASSIGKAINHGVSSR